MIINGFVTAQERNNPFTNVGDVEFPQEFIVFRVIGIGYECKLIMIDSTGVPCS
jgi:hypothetical protein